LGTERYTNVSTLYALFFHVTQEDNMSTNTLAYVHHSVINQAKTQGKIIWLYGLSGAGKSTIAAEMANRLTKMNKKVFILDGDDLRNGLNGDLKFSDQDREENLRRAAEVAKLISQTSDVVICTFITPFESSRQSIRDIMHKQDFQEFFIETSLSQCELRDTKGLYKKARMGEIDNFTGISSPFEIPNSNIKSINTVGNSKFFCAKRIIDTLF